MTQAILARAEGNPLFLEELTRAVLEQGEAPAAAAVPETLQGVLLARIDRLPPGARRALQLAAVVGRDCPLPLLEALWEGEPTALAPALVRLVEAELLYPQGVPPEAEYRFKHALIQEAAYQTLLQGPRQQAHQRIAQVLEARIPRDRRETQPELLAHHYTAAGLARPGHAVLAAGRPACPRALGQRGSDQHLTTGPGAARHPAGDPGARPAGAHLQLALGPALMATKGQAAPEVEQTYARARALCAQVGDTPQLSRRCGAYVGSIATGGRY